jgi:hypothetical protein
MSDNAGGSGKPESAEAVRHDLEETLAVVGSTVWRAKLILYVIEPLKILVSIATLAAGLYGGTWIVVLALRHSGAIQ